MKISFLLAFSTIVVLLSMICLISGPIINNIIPESSDWKDYNCKQKEDDYNIAKDQGKNLNSFEKEKNSCIRKKNMSKYEHAAFILDITLSFLCAISSLFNYFIDSKIFERVSGIIGLVTGIINIFITFLYVYYSANVLNNDIAHNYDYNSELTILNNNLLKLDEHGSFAKWDHSSRNYKCLYWDPEDKDSIIIKYKDLGKKQYNYQEIKYYPEDDSKFKLCEDDTANQCYENPEKGYVISEKNYNVCKNLYLKIYPNSFENKYIYDRWITTIVFSCFVIFASIGLFVTGLLLIVQCECTLYEESKKYKYKY